VTMGLHQTRPCAPQVLDLRFADPEAAKDLGIVLAELGSVERDKSCSQLLAILGLRAADIGSPDDIGHA
jgi:hypothetical protein